MAQTEGGIRGIGLHTFDATVEGSRLTCQKPAEEESGGGAAATFSPTVLAR